MHDEAQRRLAFKLEFPVDVDEAVIVATSRCLLQVARFGGYGSGWAWVLSTYPALDAVGRRLHNRCRQSLTLDGQLAKGGWAILYASSRCQKIRGRAAGEHQLCLLSVPQGWVGSQDPQRLNGQ